VLKLHEENKEREKIKKAITERKMELDREREE